MSAHVLMSLPADLVERMRELVAQGAFESVDACVEAALAGDPSSWSVPGGRSAAVDTSESGVQCRCCEGRCRHQFRWRNSVRCGCPPALAGDARIVQADLERE